MKSHIYRSRLEYVGLMDDFLSGRVEPARFVQSFFSLRNVNVDSDTKECIIDRGDKADRWDELFGELFAACEDVVLPGEEPRSHPLPNGDEISYSISLEEFARRVADLRDRFAHFGNGPSTAP